MNPIVIAGTGLAGYTLARELRKLDSETPLVIITADDGRFYSKPNLSNAFKNGKTPEALAMSSAEQMAAQLNAEIRGCTRITAIDSASRRIRTDSFELEYRKLVLALGADPIRLAFEGDAADAVLSVNDLDDYTQFRTALERGRRVAIIGAGLIGCEFANDLINAGFEVDIIDPSPMPLGRLLPQDSGAQLVEHLKARGVRWHLGRGAVAVDHKDMALSLTLDDGTVLAADVVLSAIGLRPRTQLAAAAGLTVKRGIVVDRRLQTSAPDIYALGDCAEVNGLVLPFVMPIMHAARALARTLAGDETAVIYPPMPVVVKTPDYPLVVSPPPLDADGEWRRPIVRLPVH